MNFEGYGNPEIKRELATSNDTSTSGRKLPRSIARKTEKKKTNSKKKKTNKIRQEILISPPFRDLLLKVKEHFAYDSLAETYRDGIRELYKKIS